MNKAEVTVAIEEELLNRFSDGEATIDFITRALGNFFDTDTLEEFYEFIKDE